MDHRQRVKIQTKLDGFNDCYLLIHAAMTDFISDKAIPEETREIMRGFVDGMERDQKQITQTYLERLVRDMRRQN